MSPHATLLEAAARDNSATLAQVCAILEGIEADHYTRRERICFDSSIGGHVRHVVEHYTSLCLGLATGLVDYEARARDSRIENDPVYALGQLKAVEEQLGHVGRGPANRALRVKSESNDDGETVCWADSSALRELEHVLSHTIHHFALIAVICSASGIAVPADFGVAPSTLRFRRRQIVVAA